MLIPGGMHPFGIRLIGATPETAIKLGLTVAVAVAVIAVRFAVVAIARAATGRVDSRALFWVKQGSSLATLAVIAVALASIWFDDPARLTTVLGLATAGVAIAAQKAVTAFAGYLVIMRGNTFTVGDRIKMGGIQGDVVALGFLQTRILEMGQPPEVNEQEDPGMWVKHPLFSGRVVRVTNDKVFAEPVYNFTREFPFIWEELHIGVGFRVDHARVEQILLEAAATATKKYQPASDTARTNLQQRYGVTLEEDKPRVYWRLTDNWLE